MAFKTKKPGPGRPKGVVDLRKLLMNVDPEKVGDVITMVLDQALEGDKRFQLAVFNRAFPQMPAEFFVSKEIEWSNSQRENAKLILTQVGQGDISIDEGLKLMSMLAHQNTLEKGSGEMHDMLAAVKETLGIGNG